MTTTRAVQIGFLISGITSVTTGNPVAGGEVFFYAAGTTTQKYVYTEKEKTNGYYSYDLDAIGAATLYGDGEYKIVIKDADGATVKTIDNMLLRYEYYGVQNVSSTPYAHTSDHDLFLVDTTVGDITINMLAADLWDRPIKVMRTAGTDNIIINPDGSETIDGAATLTISSDAIVEIISDGSNLVSVGFRSNMFDADNDTGVQVEETADDDTIRFDTGGTERVTITTTKVTSNIPLQFNSHQDADGDTSLQVENTADDDKIKGVCGGAEKLLLSPTNTEAYIIVNAVMDSDADTKVQVEEGSDEDKVRIDTGGTERVVIDSSGLDVVSGSILKGGTDIRDTVETLTNKRLTSPKINEDVALTATATQLNRLASTNTSTSGSAAGAGVTLEHTGETTVATTSISGPWSAGDWVYVDAEIAGTKGATAGRTYFTITFSGPTVAVLASALVATEMTTVCHVEASGYEIFRIGGMAKVTASSNDALVATLAGQSLGSDTTIGSGEAQLGMVVIRRL